MPSVGRDPPLLSNRSGGWILASELVEIALQSSCAGALQKVVVKSLATYITPVTVETLNTLFAEFNSSHCKFVQSAGWGCCLGGYDPLPESFCGMQCLVVTPSACDKSQ